MVVFFLGEKLGTMIQSMAFLGARPFLTNFKPLAIGDPHTYVKVETLFPGTREVEAERPLFLKLEDLVNKSR